jgi:2-methylcitrate dehydratase
MVDRLGGSPDATILATGKKTSAPLAALANGTALRYLDFNASYGGRDPGKVSGLVPATLAVAEGLGQSGRDLIAALVAGGEVQCRLCDFAGAPRLKSRGWHNSCSLGMAAAVATAHLLAGDSAAMAEAISISGTHLNTLAQIQHGRISAIKASADGWAAKGGIEAAMLAASGLTGPEEILEGRAGWTAAVAGGLDYDAFLAPLGGRYRVAEARIKSFAAAGSNQMAVQAAVDIRDQESLRIDRIARIEVLLPEKSYQDPAVNDETKRFPRNRETADHSFYYTVAIALLDGECGEAQYHPDKLASPAVRALLEKTSLQADPELANVKGAGVRIVLSDGTVHERRHLRSRGKPDPLSDRALLRKFDRHMAEVYGKAESDAIKAAILDLDRCRDMRDFTRLF